MPPGSVLVLSWALPEGYQGMNELPMTKGQLMAQIEAQTLFGELVKMAEVMFDTVQGTFCTLGRVIHP